MNSLIVYMVYLGVAVMFIVGIKMLTKIKSSRTGNILSSVGMLISIIATVLLMEQNGTVGYMTIIVGLILGGLIGTVMARMVKITAMPQMVAILNGLGGGASVLVAVSFLLAAETA